MVTHSTVVRNALTNWMVNKLDGGSLVFMTENNIAVTTLLFGTPAFGSAVNGVATANAITRDEGAIGGIISKAKLYDSNDNEVVACSVTVAGGNGDIILSSVNVAPTQAVELTAMTYAAMP